MFCKPKFFAKATLLILVIVLITGFCLVGEEGKSVEYDGKKAKYVFLFIGDGMGIAQIHSAELFLSSGAGDKIERKKLNMTGFPSQGLTTTNSADSFITDSAAAGTALACGEKTDSGVLGMDSSRKKILKSMAESAFENGKKVGIVSSVSIDHATPASFYAHEPSRGNYYEICLQMADSGFQYFAGGGMNGNTERRRKDRKDLIGILEDKGYKIVKSKDELMSLKNDKNQKVLAMDPYLDGGKALYYELDRKEDSVSLAEYTRKGIELLDNDKGFFMMVEGGKIDWACHANDAGSSIHDVLAFDNAIKEAVEFYKKHYDETLIVVTADHECGGMTTGFAGTGYKTFFEKIRHQKASYIEFNKILADYKKEHDKDEAKLEHLADEIEECFGLIFAGDEETTGPSEMLLTEYETQQIRDAFNRSLKGEKVHSSNEQTYLLYGSYEPLTVTLTHVLNNKAGIGWTSYSHTAVPVPAFATGVGHELFNGYYDNTEIFHKIMAIMI